MLGGVPLSFGETGARGFHLEVVFYYDSAGRAPQARFCVIDVVLLFVERGARGGVSSLTRFITRCTEWAYWGSERGVNGCCIAIRWLWTIRGLRRLDGGVRCYFSMAGYSRFDVARGDSARQAPGALACFAFKACRSGNCVLVVVWLGFDVARGRFDLVVCFTCDFFEPTSTWWCLALGRLRLRVVFLLLVNNGKDLRMAIRITRFGGRA